MFLVIAITMLAESTNVSTGQMVGGGGVLVGVGAVGMWLLKALPVVNEERKKFRSGAIEEWEKFAKKQTEEIDRLKNELQSQEMRFMQRLTDQENRFRECYENAKRMQIEIEGLRSELGRLELSQKIASLPIVLNSAEWTIDNEGIVKTATEGFIPLLGLTSNDMVGSHVRSFIGGPVKSVFMEVLEECKTSNIVHVCPGIAIHAVKDLVKVFFIMDKQTDGNIQIVVVPRK